jgi:hypothetical protein
MSKSNTPGASDAGSMPDMPEFMKNMWGGMKMPGMVMPTLSVDDINKQIADLKAVESWLTLNMNMLRGTIQALEVQSATIATLQSMNASISAMMQPNANATEDKPPFTSPFSTPMPGAGKPETPGSESPTPSATEAAGAAMPPFADAAVWWNMLQDQFKQAVNTAVAPKADAPAAESASSARKRKSPKT